METSNFVVKRLNCMRAERIAVDEEEEYRVIGGYLPASRQSRRVAAQNNGVTRCTKAAIDAFIGCGQKNR
ncbi:hypothetical protein [Thermoactinomyces mirandus]|uniref:Uncharacterized protein n=1 Tax=Thermoactinomyces mirandus TaxID=2756294 RepID=A0A7W1XU72_9BACL|nr:hypothetical protein [Thermoactinomyces mirandus]MBA4603374.1 hypothetical protein [Thermoactinomyces mirandus]